MSEIRLLVGKTLTSVDGLHNDSDYVKFNTDDGIQYCMYHEQNCCECVSIEDVCGDADDLLNTPILQAVESSSDTCPYSPSANDDYNDLKQWTFYRISTIKGTVVIRWYGCSNGYYGVGVAFRAADDVVGYDRRK